MNAVKCATNLAGFLRYFSETHELRPTRMGVFEESRGTVIDYWLEDGLPLTGIDVDNSNPEKPSVLILLSNKEGTEKSHFSHVINDVKLVKVFLSFDGKSDGLDISSFDGKTTVLRFENELE